MVLEEVSVPGLVLFSFQAAVRSAYCAGTCAVVFWLWFYLLLTHVARSVQRGHPGKDRSGRHQPSTHTLSYFYHFKGFAVYDSRDSADHEDFLCAVSHKSRLPRAFVVPCGILAGSLSLACLYAGVRGWGLLDVFY